MKLTHGHAEQAEDTVSSMEQDIRGSGKELPQHDDKSDGHWIKAGEALTPKQLAYVFFKLYPPRTVLGATLMITQSSL